jgi:hypothetical protein
MYVVSCRFGLLGRNLHLTFGEGIFLSKRTSDMRIYTEEEIDALKSPRGGWTKKTLKSIGVGWPPEKGWRQRLLGKELRQAETPNEPRARGDFGLKNGFWRTASGDEIHVRDMRTAHIENAMSRLYDLKLSVEDSLNAFAEELERRGHDP